jgi:Tricorn protease C1 domain
VRFALTMLAVGIAGAFCLIAQTPNELQQDFDVAIKRIAATYAYFDARATRWNDVPALYAADLQGVKSRDEFIALLERALDELYDPHMQLSVNLERSFRLVPSGTDLWAEWREGRATITQVRGNSDAERAGLKHGTIVIAIDGVPVGEAIEARLGRSYAHSVAAARDWALRTVLAGRHNTRRLLQIQEQGVTRTVELPPPISSLAGGRSSSRLSFASASATFDSMTRLETAPWWPHSIAPSTDFARHVASSSIFGIRRAAATAAWHEAFWGDLSNESCPTRSTSCRPKSAPPESAGAGSSSFHDVATMSMRDRLPCSSAAGLAAWVKAWRSGSMQQRQVPLSAWRWPALWERR